MELSIALSSAGSQADGLKTAFDFPTSVVELHILSIAPKVLKP